MELATRAEMRWALVRTMAVVATLVVLFAALAGKVGIAGRDLWFAGLNRPGYIPTPAAFTLWWSLFFLLLGLAFAIVQQARGAHYRMAALVLIASAFVCGLAWLPVSLGMRQLQGGAMIGGLGALLGVAATIVAWRIRKSAGLLMLLVTLWTGFCGLSAWQLWQSNKGGPTSAPENMAGTNSRF